MREETKGHGYTVTATVKEIKGKYEVGCRGRDNIIFAGLSVKGKLCSSALATMEPTLYASMSEQNFLGMKIGT